MMKKLFAFVLAVTISFWALAPNASAQTIEELQAQIATLTAQLAALEVQLSGLGGTTGTITGCSITSFDRNLSAGMTGDDVKCLQIVLNSDAATKLADSGAGSPGNETTYFGPITKAAAIKFQEKYADEVLASWGLTSGTGYIGSTSRAKLNSLLTTGVVDDGDGEVIIGGFSAALAADTPEAGTIVSDSTSGDGAQALVPMLRIKFSNGNSTDVSVTELAFKRQGISADTDIAQGYLYDGNTNLAEYNSLSSGVMTFSGSLFTVEAGSSKTITLRMDLTDETLAGKTMYFSLLSADSITSDAASVGGTFPIEGNIMTTARASDLGKLTVATTTQPSTTPDPQDDFEVFNFSLQGQDQKLEIRQIKLTNMGSTDWNDLQNLKLYDGGAQLLSTIASMDADKTVTFDFSGDPLIIEKGITKQMHVRADIVGGTNRTFQFSIQERNDIEVYDTEYGIYIKPDGGSTWVVHSVGASTIQTGKLSLSRASDSASGNVVRDGTNVSVAKFNVKATGEDVKIANVVLRIYGTIAGDGLYQTKVYFDGSQKGSTANAAGAATDVTGADTTYTFGNTFVVPADGDFHTIEIKGDIKASSSASITGGKTLTAKVESVSATGRDSLAGVSSVSSVGYLLTITSGELAFTRNSAVAHWSSVVPTGVLGESGAIVGAYTITAGASEGADITSIKIVDDGTNGFVNLLNLEVYHGTKETGTKVGNTQSSLTTNTTYTFYPSPYISLDANQTALIYVYADIDTSTTTSNLGNTVMTEVSATGKVTNTSVGSTTDANGQTLYLSGAGSLTIAVGDDTPITANVLGGSGELISFTQTKFTAGAGEDINVTKVIYNPRRMGGAPTSTVYDISLWDGSTQIGSTVAGLSASAGSAIFDLSSDPWIVSAGATKNLLVKAKVPIVDTVNASSGAYIAFHASTSDANGDASGITYKGAVSGSEATSNTAYEGNDMYTYKTDVSVAASANTPSGQSFPITNEELFYFDVTNLGSYTAWLNGVTTTISWSAGTGNATFTATRIFYLYDSDYPGTVLGSTTYATDSTATLNGLTLTMNFDVVKAIPTGDTKTFWLKGDMNEAAAAAGGNPGTVAVFYLADGTDFNWDDGVSAAVQTTRTFATNIQGGTLTF